jgi:hypothetical protein
MDFKENTKIPDPVPPGSAEQLAEKYSREIFDIKHKLLDDFFLAYAAQLCLEKGERIDLQNLTLIETRLNPARITFHWEYHGDEDDE